jgi:hypothetical protein
LCQRSAHARIPVLAVEDACEAITPVLDLEIATEQSSLHTPDFRLFPAADAEVPDDHVAQHLGKQVVQISAGSDAAEEPIVQLLRGFQIEPVKSGVIKEVPLDAPGFVVHLLPLGCRRNLYLEVRGLELASAAPPPVAPGAGLAPAGGAGGRLRMNQFPPCCRSIFSPFRATSKLEMPLSATSARRVLRSNLWTVSPDGAPGTAAGASTANRMPALPVCSAT